VAIAAEVPRRTSPDFTVLKPGRTLFRFMRRQPLGAVSLVILLVIWSLALFSPVIAPYDWSEPFTGDKFTAPTFTDSHYFGTDDSGRDVFSRVLQGGRISLTTSLYATVGSVTMGAVFGILSGYVLGKFDLVFQRFVDALQAMPGLIVLMVAGAVFPGNRAVLIMILMVLQMPVLGRVLRSQVLQMRTLPYVEAARALGASNPRVLLRHIFPNVAPLILVVFSVLVGGNMLVLTALAFLGVVDPATPDWGSMLNTATTTSLVSAPWVAIFPGLAITISVLAYNLLGDALRDELDPRLRGAR
jgi:ABC-type dipeptide/oligopeptide/nickel transport system permease subunit